MRNLTKTAMLLAGCAITATATPTWAQDLAANDSADENVIIVTAQNRAQNEQDVPIKMDVISADQLQAAGFKDANDLAQIAPVAMVNQDQGTVRVTIRGIGTTSGGSQDNSVVTNIDGEYINSPSALGVALFDLERVEVLRGPQGTLYGRNATAGAVNFITRKPGDTFAGNISASYGNYNAIRLDAGFDVPLGTDVGMRFAGFYEDRDGYVKHPGLAAGNYAGYNFPGYDAGRSDDNHAYGGRASFLADNIGGLSVYLAGEYSEREFTPQVFAFQDTAGEPGSDCSAPGWEVTAPLITDQTLCIPANTHYLKDQNRAEYAAPAAGIGRQYWNTYALRSRIDYEFGPEATLSYIGGYRRFEIEPDSFSTLPVIYSNLNTYNISKTQSHELRLAGEISGVIYQIGGFYFKEKIRSLGGYYLGDITEGTSNFGLYINYNLRNSNSDSKSAFGQVEVPLNDTLTVVGGVRYTDNDNRGQWRDKAGFFMGPQERDPADGGFTDISYLEAKGDKITWLVGVNYKPDPDTLIYGKVSTGFKGGGFDSVGTFGPESNTAYEAGLKKGFGDRGQHIFNLTGFYYDYTGLQVDVLLSSAEGGRTFNAGKATIWGVEAEARFEITENDHFNASVNYLNAELKELYALYTAYCVDTSEGGVGDCTTDTGDYYTSVGDLDPATDGIQSPNFAGHTPGFSPKWIITAGYDHVFDLGDSGKLTFRADSTFKSSYYTDFLNYADSKQTAYTSSDVSLEYRSNFGLSVAAYVRNLEGTRPLTQAYYLSAGPDDIWNWQFGPPRTYGLQLGYEF